VGAVPDRHFPVQAPQEIEQLVGREATKMTIHEVRDFRLLDAKQRRCLTLLEIHVSEDPVDIEAQLRPCEEPVRVLEAQIRKDIARAFLELNAHPVLPAHGAPVPSPCCIVVLSNLST